jgi:hypothetical protein
MLEVERILMVDFASTQAQAKEVAPSANREGDQTEATVAKPPSTSPPLTTNGVDKMYHQLAEVHAIAATQLADCAHRHRSDPTSTSVRVGIGWQKPATIPSALRLALSPPTDFSSRAMLWW